MSATARPNLLWIVMEDVSPRFGCYGDDLAETPAIDSLAAAGRRYTNAFCTAGVCAPSRASLMTGLYPPSLGCQHMRTRTHDVEGLPDPYEAVPPHYVTAFTEYLRQAGYYCTLDSKTDYQFGEPFTMWDHHESGAGWWDDAREDDQPFFAMLTNGVTHESGMWDPDDGGEIADPETDPSAVEVPPYLIDSAPTRRAIARQYDNLATADAWIADVIDRLDRDGHREDTIVMLTADHGEGLPRKKRWPYDSGTHVPLIVRWPGRTGGEVSDELVSLVDLPATTLALAGVDRPAYIDGQPFLAADGPARSYVFSTRDRYDEEYDMVRSVRDDRYRYVRNYYLERPYVLHIPYRNTHPAMRELLRAHAEDGLDTVQERWFAPSRPAEELYDLRADPHETTNLIDDPSLSDVRDRLRDALDDWRTQTDDRSAAAEDETRLRERGWAGGSQPGTAPVRFVANAPGARARDTTDGGRFAGPMTVALYCPTQGASIAYATGDDADPRWRIYDGPLRLQLGADETIRAKAVRYGYRASAVTDATFEVIDGSNA